MTPTTPLCYPPPARARILRRKQDGYALVIILFFVALLTIAVAKASLSVVTNTRRDKEEEMIWRGRQYVRGIRLYYGKLHRFPTALDDLYKPKTGLRFMRQAYKDPMNVSDGSWRMIYVGPNGQLIGSLKNRTVNMAGQPTGGFGGAAGPGGGASTGSSSFFGSSNGFGSASSFGGTNNNGFGANNQPPGATNAPLGQATTNGQPANTTDSADQNDSLQPQPLSDSPTIMGGNIIGVGSKMNKKSIKWFEKAKNYRQYEFVWDPSVDSLTGARPGLPTSTASPFGATGAPGSAATPFGTSPTPTPTPTANPPMGTDPTGPPLQAPPNQ